MTGKRCCCCQVVSVVSDSVRPHGLQPTRLLCPWDSPGKNTEVGGHFLLQCMKVESESEVVQSCPTLHDLMDCSPPGSSIHGIFQARVLECSAIAFSIGELYPSPIRYYHLIGAVTEYSTGDSIVLSNQMRNVVRLVSSMNR